MPHPHRRRHRGPKPDRRRALELLAASHDGGTEALVRGHGFTVKQMVELARDDGARGRPAVVRSRSLACGLLRLGGRRYRNDEALDQIDA